MDTNKDSLPALDSWQVQLLRLTLFPTPAAEISEPNWWNDLTGAKPDQRTLLPAKGELHEEGPFDNGKLSLRVRPFRVDWLFEGAVADSVSNLGPFSEVTAKFHKLMLTWLNSNSAPPAVRIAFGAVLLQPVDSHASGYTLLSRYLPNVELSPDARDFFYQINRPTKSKTSQFEQVELNRLSKWACAMFQRRILELGPASSHTVSSGKKHYACRLELDFSTPAELAIELKREYVGDIFTELLGLGTEIARKGDF